jgi:hypothetical protein
MRIMVWLAEHKTLMLRINLTTLLLGVVAVVAVFVARYFYWVWRMGPPFYGSRGVVGIDATLIMLPGWTTLLIFLGSVYLASQLQLHR